MAKNNNLVMVAYTKGEVGKGETQIKPKKFNQIIKLYAPFYVKNDKIDSSKLTFDYKFFARSLDSEYVGDSLISQVKVPFGEIKKVLKANGWKAEKVTNEGEYHELISISCKGEGLMKLPQALSFKLHYDVFAYYHAMAESGLGWTAEAFINNMETAGKYYTKSDNFAFGFHRPIVHYEFYRARPEIISEETTLSKSLAGLAEFLKTGVSRFTEYLGDGIAEPANLDVRKLF